MYNRRRRAFRPKRRVRYRAFYRPFRRRRRRTTARRRVIGYRM